MNQERLDRLQFELALLQKSKWGWKDLMSYYQCGSEKANQIRKRALARGGKAPFDEHKVLSKVVLLTEDKTTPEDEIRKRVIELNDE